MPKRNNHDNGEARAAKERNRKRAKVRYERKMAKAAALLLINTFKVQNSEISVTPTTRNIGSQTYDASLPQKFKIEGNGNSAIEMNPGNCIDCNP